jgi:hypothetical protein
MRRHDVFISYRRDLGAHFATGVRSALERAGLDVALDVDILKGGLQFLPQLKRSIESSRHFVLLLTVGSLARMNEPDDVSAIEVATAYASGCHVLVLFDDKAARPGKTTVLPAEIRQLLDGHMILYEHLLAKASIQHLLEALEADSKSRQHQAITEFHRIDAAVQDPAFQKWQTNYLHELYTPAAESLGLTTSGLFFPLVRGQLYPVMCFEGPLDGAPFTHGQLSPHLQSRQARELPKLLVDPDAEIPAWASENPLRRKYFELLSYAQRVRRWNMRGFALAALRIDATGRVAGFDARICTYGENCLTSHVLGFDLLESWRQDKPGQLELPRPALDAVLHNPGDNFLPLISVQAIVAYRDEDGTWRAITMERSGNLAAAAGFWQFPPAGGFEIFGSEEDDEDYVRQQFDMRMALMREFLEEIFGDVEMACEAPEGSGSEQEGAEGYRLLLKTLRSGQATIHFLGVVTELVSMRPEFSFLIVINDIDYFRDLRYSHSLPTGEIAKAQWLMARSETRRLNTSSLGDLDGLFAVSRKWHSSSVGMLVLLSRASRIKDGWLRTRYPDFPELSLS